MASLLSQAKELVKWGFSVIPIDYCDKKPSVAWKEFQSRMATSEELERWFGPEDDPKESNIAICTGPISGLTVVDVDPRNGGSTTIEGCSLGRATVITGGNGYHYYYRYIDEAKGTKPGRWQGIDIKSDGGYVLCPPSLTTGSYLYSVSEKFPPLRREPEAWLLEKMVAMVKHPEREIKKTWINTKGGFIKVLLKDVAVGGRNNHAAKLYGALLYEGASPARAASVLKLWNDGLSSPLPTEEIDAVIASITSKHVKRIKT